MFRISLLRFGRRNNRDYINVCLCGYNVLLHKNHATDRAMFSLGQTRFGTGGFDCFVDNLGVTLFRNNVLLHKNLITDRAMLAIGLARLGAGGFDRFVNDFGVALGGNGSRFPLPAGTGTFLFSVPGAGCRPNGCPFAERVPVRGVSFRFARLYVGLLRIGIRFSRLRAGFCGL